MNFLSFLRGLVGSKRDVEAPPSPPAPTVLPPVEPAGLQGRDGFLPEFRTTASPLLGRSGNNDTDKARQRVRSAFTPSQPISNARKFAGRRELLASIIRVIEDQQAHVVIFGERGIGKTSMLHVLAELSRRARYVVRYFSCSEGADFSEVLRAVVADIPLLYHVDLDPTSEDVEAGGSFADLLPEGPITVAQVSDLLAKIANAQVLIMLDEFDRSEGAQFRRETAELMKTLSDRAIRVQFVIAGVAANLTELVGYIPSIRRNVVGIPVPPMTRSEVSALISIGQSISGVPFRPEATEGVIRIAHGLPYVASLLAHHASVAATERGASAVEEQDVFLALQRATADVQVQISPQSRFFIERIEENGGGYVLQNLASSAFDHGGRIHLEGIARQMLAASSRDTGKPADLSLLIEPIPDDASGAYRFREEGAALLLRMKHALDEPESGRAQAALGRIAE